MTLSTLGIVPASFAGRRSTAAGAAAEEVPGLLGLLANDRTASSRFQSWLRSDRA